MKREYDDIFAAICAMLVRNNLYWQSGKLYYDNGKRCRMKPSEMKW